MIGDSQFQVSFLCWSSLSQSCCNTDIDQKGLQWSAPLISRNYIVVMNCNFDEVWGVCLAVPSNQRWDIVWWSAFVFASWLWTEEGWFISVLSSGRAGLPAPKSRCGPDPGKFSPCWETLKSLRPLSPTEGPPPGLTYSLRGDRRDCSADTRRERNSLLWVWESSLELRGRGWQESCGEGELLEILN